MSSSDAKRSTDEYERYRAYYDEGYKADHPLAYGREDDARPDELRGQTVDWLARTGVAARPDATVVELGCAMGQLRDVHPGYLGLDFSLSALARGRALVPGLGLVQGDMQALPFRTASVDLFFSWAAIEHVPAPERVLAEVERTLKPGGFAVLGPAWNCRSWTVKRLDIRPYRELSIRECVEKATIPVRSKLAWRAALSVPARVRRELQGALGLRTRFDYRRLHPDFSLNLPHVSDDDAQASMDPHAAIMFYWSRGWRVLSHPTLGTRLLARGEPVVVQKPG